MRGNYNDDSIPYFSNLSEEQKVVVANAFGSITKSEWQYYPGTAINSKKILQKEELTKLNYFAEKNVLEIAEFERPSVTKIHYDKFLNLYYSGLWQCCWQDKIRSRDNEMKYSANLTQEQKEFVVGMLSDITDAEWGFYPGTAIISCDSIGRKVADLRPFVKLNALEIGVSTRVAIIKIDYGKFLESYDNWKNHPKIFSAELEINTNERNRAKEEDKRDWMHREEARKMRRTIRGFDGGFHS